MTAVDRAEVLHAHMRWAVRDLAARNQLGTRQLDGSLSPLSGYLVAALADALVDTVLTTARVSDHPTVTNAGIEDSLRRRTRGVLSNQGIVSQYPDECVEVILEGILNAADSIMQGATA